MIEYLWETAEEMDQAYKRVRAIRKRRSISQEYLSELSGVSFGSIKRFENTGKISLLSLTKIAVYWDVYLLLLSYTILLIIFVLQTRDFTHGLCVFAQSSVSHI